VNSLLLAKLLDQQAKFSDHQIEQQRVNTQFFDKLSDMLHKQNDNFANMTAELTSINNKLGNLDRYNTNRDNELESIMVDSFARELEKNGWIDILPLSLSTIINSGGTTIMEFDGFLHREALE
jgi:hypothetical protein